MAYYFVLLPMSKPDNVSVGTWVGLYAKRIRANTKRGWQIKFAIPPMRIEEIFREKNIRLKHKDFGLVVRWIVKAKDVDDAMHFKLKYHNAIWKEYHG